MRWLDVPRARGVLGVFAIMLAGVLGCGGASPPAPAPAPKPAAPAPPAPAVVPAPPAPPAPRYLALFDDLIRRIERAHVFPPSYARDVGRPWRDDIPRLRDEFARARDRGEALIALRHLQNSLRDTHCHLDPPRDLQRQSLRLGVDLWAGGTWAAPDVRIARVVDPSLTDVAPGDTVTAIDGVPLATWLDTHPFETRMLSPAPALAETIAQITRADMPWSATRPGDQRVLTIVHAGASRDLTLQFQRGFPSTTRMPDLDRPPAMADVDCDPASPVDYGDYRLTDVGVNVCIYRPTRPSRPRLAIVRYRSFLYRGNDPAHEMRMVKVDHDLLARSLRGIDGVILDLHDNRGGNNPFLFLGWFASRPWDHPRVVTRVVPDLDSETVARIFFSDDDRTAYRTAQTSAQPTHVSHFLCTKPPCTGISSPPSERVTRAPVAVIVGPNCVSSCDTFTLMWSTFQLGPILGRQPAHAYTVIRLPIPLTGPDHEDLGTFRLALSHSEVRDGISIEGEPLRLDWQAPTSFETRTTWLRSTIAEAAIRLTRPTTRPAPASR